MSSDLKDRIKPTRHKLGGRDVLAVGTVSVNTVMQNMPGKFKEQ